METKGSLRLLFYIKRTKLLKNGKAPLFLKITINRKFTEFALHHSIDPILWNTISGQLEGKSKEALSSNEFIDSVKFRIKNIINELNNNNHEITGKNIREKYLGKKSQSHTILNEFNKHNEMVKSLIGIDYAPLTYKLYKTTYNHLAKFIALEYNLTDLSIDKIDYNVITSFEHYLKINRQCSHNTTMKNLVRLNKVFKLQVKKGYTANQPFKDIKLAMHRTNKEFLTEEELIKIINKKFDINRIEQVKDCFLFSCFTGLAYNEIKNLKAENIVLGIDGNKWISIIRQKSKENNICKVPILQFAQDILDKYSNNQITQSSGYLLPVLSNQKMNSYLKEIADLCGITKNLTSHIARHTFATTVTLNNGVPIESVSKMLGHSDIKTTKIYAKLLDKRISKDMKNIKKKYANI